MIGLFRVVGGGALDAPAFGTNAFAARRIESQLDTNYRPKPPAPGTSRTPSPTGAVHLDGKPVRYGGRCVWTGDPSDVGGGTERLSRFAGIIAPYGCGITPHSYLLTPHCLPWRDVEAPSPTGAVQPLTPHSKLLTALTSGRRGAVPYGPDP